MTQFLPYDTLTWPEVDALPRATPLVIPFGSGYDLDRLASALGEPERAFLLPPVPYGWPGSGLSAAPERLSALARNLVTSLRQDGFTRVFALTPQGVDLDLGKQQIALPHPAQFAPASPLPADGEREKVILIPIGHTEQHAYHLPMSTDTLIIEAIAQGVAQASPARAACLPVFPYGVSMHRASFAGTLDCGGRAFEDFWLAIIDTLMERGFTRLYLLSGHGGNMSFLVNVIKYAGERYPQAFIATSFLYLSGPEGVAALESRRRSPIGGMGHACELETALILHLRPDLARMERAVDELDFIATPSYYMDWVEGGALIANPSWNDDTISGAYGAGSFASSENGAFWLEAAIREKVTHVEEIHAQHARRSARRQSGYGEWGKMKAGQPSR